MRIDLHIHTCYSSDSNLQLTDIIDAVNKGKIDGVAITDHNEIEGALELKRIAPFPVIVGEEILTTEGEIIGFFLQHKIKPGLSLKKTIKDIKDQGGLVAVPHPFDRLRSSAINSESLDTICDKIDLIEVFNSRNVYKKDNERANSYADKNNITKIVGSDAHIKYEIGCAYIEMPPFNTAEEFLICVKKGIFFTSKSSILVHLETKARKILQRGKRK